MVPVAVVGAVVLRRRRLLLFPFVAMVLLTSLTAVVGLRRRPLRRRGRRGPGHAGRRGPRRRWPGSWSDGGGRGSGRHAVAKGRGNGVTASMTGLVERATDQAPVIGPGPESPAPGRPPRFPAFDGLRAIAAVTVVAVHVGFVSGLTPKNPSGVGMYTARLEIGVSVFFLISGFLLYRPFVVAHLAGAPKPRTGAFWLRRLLRIVPAYWLVLFVSTSLFHTGVGDRPGRVEGLRLPLPLPPDLLPVPGSEGDLGGLEPVRRDDLLPLHPALRRTPRAGVGRAAATPGPSVASSSASSSWWSSASPGGSPCSSTRATTRRTSGWPPSGCRPTSTSSPWAWGWPWSARGCTTGAARRAWLSTPVVPLGLVGGRAGLLLGRVPHRLAHPPGLLRVGPRPGPPDPVRVVRLLPAAPGGLRAPGSGTHPPIPPVVADGVARDHLLRHLPLARDVDLPDPRPGALPPDFNLEFWAFFLAVLGLSIISSSLSYFVVEKPALRLKNSIAWWRRSSGGTGGGGGSDGTAPRPVPSTPS